MRTASPDNGARPLQKDRGDQHFFSPCTLRGMCYMECRVLWNALGQLVIDFFRKTLKFRYGGLCSRARHNVELYFLGRILSD